jgi:hypothetical protein
MVIFFIYFMSNKLTMKSKFNHFLLLVLFSIAWSGCSKDKEDTSTNQSGVCDGITCLNGGECVNGNCDCPEGYTGSDCGQLDLDVSITVHSITISGYPTTDNGYAWDDPLIGSSTPPDVQWRFVRPDDTVISGGLFNDATAPSLYYSNTSLPFTIPMPDIDETNTIVIYDVDDLDASDTGSSDDFMGGWDFTPETFIDDALNPFPSTIVLGSGNDIIFTLDVSYDW